MDLSKISDFCYHHLPQFNFGSTGHESYFELFKSCVSGEEQNNCQVAFTTLCATAAGVGIASLIAIMAGKYLFKHDNPQTTTPLEKIEEFDRADKTQYHSKKLEDAYIPIYAMRNQIVKKMAQTNIWDDPEFKREFSQYMEESFKLTEMMFKELQRVSTTHPLKKNNQQELMARLLIHQWKNDKQPIFLYAFFALAQPYRLARSRMYVENDTFKKPPKLTEADEDRFLMNEEAPEFRWRLLFNTFRENFLALGFEIEVQKMDERVWNFIGYPDENYLSPGHGLFQMPTLKSYHNQLKMKFTH